MRTHSKAQRSNKNVKQASIKKTNEITNTPKTLWNLTCDLMQAFEIGQYCQQIPNHKYCCLWQGHLPWSSESSSL